MKDKFQKLHLEARKAKEVVKKDAYETVLNAIQQKEIELRRDLSEPEVVAIAQKTIKQFRETADFAYQAGKSNVDEKIKASAIEELLPKQLSDEELLPLIQDIITKHGLPLEKRSLGIVMGFIKGAKLNTTGEVVSRLFNTLL